MKIHFLLDPQVHSHPPPVSISTMALLAGRGFAVSSGIPESGLLSPDRLSPRHDLYVLKSRSELALSVAGVLHDRGGRFLNPQPACVLAQNRITAASRLAAAGVPVPRSWVTADFAHLCDLAAEQPVIVKPCRAQSGGGHLVARHADDLAGVPLREHPVLVQEFIAGDGHDLKVVVIGEHVFALRRRMREGSALDAGAPVRVTAPLRDLALRCGRAFGLDVFGIDVVVAPFGPVVVDFDHAPGFAHLPAAAPVLARHVERVARGPAAPASRAPSLQGRPDWADAMHGATA